MYIYGFKFKGANKHREKGMCLPTSEPQATSDPVRDNTIVLEICS